MRQLGTLLLYQETEREWMSMLGPFSAFNSDLDPELRGWCCPCPAMGLPFDIKLLWKHPDTLCQEDKDCLLQTCMSGFCLGNITTGLT